MCAAQWIDRACRAARSRFGQLLVNAYGEELGGDPEEISAITVVACSRDRPGSFSPYEESDQRYHIRGGNDQIVARLAAQVDGAIETRTASWRCRAAATAAIESWSCATARSDETSPIA